MSQPNYNFKTYSQTHWSMFRPWTYGTEFIPTFSIASSIFLHACFFFFLFHVRIQLLTSLRYQTLCIHKPTHLFIIFLSKPLKKHWLYRSYTSSIYWWYTKLSLPVVDLCWPVKHFWPLGMLKWSLKICNADALRDRLFIELSIWKKGKDNFFVLIFVRWSDMIMLLLECIFPPNSKNRHDTCASSPKTFSFTY